MGQQSIGEVRDGEMVTSTGQSIALEALYTKTKYIYICMKHLIRSTRWIAVILIISTAWKIYISVKKLLQLKNV